MSMNGQYWVRKLTSRKFWVAIIGFVTSLLLGFGVEAGDIEKVSAIIMAGATAVSYIIGEGMVDVESIKKIEQNG